MTVGVRAVVTNNSGAVLLVRHRYLPGWYLPGGGVKKGESLLDAIRRELEEETGVRILGMPKMLGAYSNFAEYKSDHVVVFVVTDWEEKQAKSLEIHDHRFFSTHDLPQGISPATERRLGEFATGVHLTFSW